MISVSDLPLLNAFLNTCSAAFLVIGHHFMKKGNIPAHRKSMITVFILSGLFLTSYLIYHYHHGSQPFQGEGWVRPVYFAILLSHTVLATLIVPLAIITLRRGLKGNYEVHRRIARWTYPVWLYVSVTGVVIYLMLYQIFR
ncbi:MAG: DUF420 domain-containing protein [Ignavibacteriales bacterium]|nr:DUF420 domain-containing protein [Ignavibacteriales bacterium]